MTDSPAENPAADPASGPPQDLASAAGAPPSVQPYTDPVEEQGARFARQADEDDEDDEDGTQRPATGGDPSGSDLSPDFLAPTQPS